MNYHTPNSVDVPRCNILMTRSCRIGISDYTKTRALVSSHHEQSSNPNEIILPTMASSVACQKNRKGKSLKLNYQREKSAQGLRSTLRREQSVPRGLGLSIHRESSAPRGLGFSNRTARAMQERDGGASPRTNIKIVYDSKTQKHSIVSDVVAVSPVKQTRRASMSSVIFHRGLSFDDKKEIFFIAPSPVSVLDVLSTDLSPTNFRVIIAPEDRRKLRVPIKSNTKSIHVGRAVSSAVATTSKAVSRTIRRMLNLSRHCVRSQNSKTQYCIRRRGCVSG
jgi:hypothetical protein